MSNYKVGDVVVRTMSGSADVGVTATLVEKVSHDSWLTTYEPTEGQGPDCRKWIEHYFKLHVVEPEKVEVVKFEPLANKLGKLTDEKNAAYGSSVDSSEKIMAIMFPNGIPVERYSDVLLMTRVLDKLQRIATKKDAFGESPWCDIVGYALIGAAKDGVK